MPIENNSISKTVKFILLELFIVFRFLFYEGYQPSAFSYQLITLLIAIWLTADR